MPRQKEPTELLKLKGSWRAKERGDEPKPQKGSPEVPHGLSDNAKKVWDEVSPLLGNMNVLTVVDGTALEMLCETYVRWRDAEDKIRKHGTVFPIRNDDGSVRYLQQSPFVGQANQAAQHTKNKADLNAQATSAKAVLDSDILKQSAQNENVGNEE